MSIPSTSFKKDEVLVFLGAGASVDAGIPHSTSMVHQIEAALASEWKEFRDLYNYVRSAIYYADGIGGKYAPEVSYNIERLVASLDELSRREEHPLYPFIGAWNPRLAQVAGTDFRNVAAFKDKILHKLRYEWIEIGNYEQAAAYYGGLVRFQQELNYPLRVFSLNYDLCVEKAYQAEYGEFPERGFDKGRKWSHELMEESEQTDKSVYLYKLHGSIDWYRESQSGRLTFSDSTSKIKPDDAALIFGTMYKLQYVDPFLFLVYQLRRFSLNARLILCIGYGFGDEHINGILAQALRGNKDKRIVAVNWIGSAGEASAIAKFKSYVAKQLELEGPHDPRLVVEDSCAKEYMSDQLSLARLASHFPAEEQIFGEVGRVPGTNTVRTEPLGSADRAVGSTAAVAADGDLTSAAAYGSGKF